MAGFQYPCPIKPTRTRIGWIGIGVMGAAMASRLLSAGYSLSIYARSPSKAAALLSLGAHLATSPADLAASTDVIFTMIGHPSDVRHLVLDTLVPSLKPNTVIIDHTSSHPALAREIHSSAHQRHCHAIDAPVSGGDIGASEGKLAIFAGGDAEVVEWLKPLFDVLGKVTYMGSAGKGQSCKIANQIVVGGSLVGLSEGLVFAKKAGMDKKKFLGAIRGGAAGSMALELFGERMIDRDFRPGGFAEYMVKDLGMAVDVEEEEGRRDEAVVLPGAGLCKQLYSGMVANGDGKLGTQGVITVVERINGIKD
ncbi:putative 3-hydroxyisobutyrate dehydrogenase-like 2, mitochondrial [Primulina tabacum]|uniref:putative 3-hydroxyisobutyrate dehydrogenase-like 2, mitochondrial n=1 Tax=Primulina tabacum TaxID=48773 RepID=UPI003F5AAB36